MIVFVHTLDGKILELDIDRFSWINTLKIAIQNLVPISWKQYTLELDGTVLENCMIMNTDIDNGSDINVVLLPYTDRALNACELQASQADSKANSPLSSSVVNHLIGDDDHRYWRSVNETNHELLMSIKRDLVELKSVVAETQKLAKEAKKSLMDVKIAIKENNNTLKQIEQTAKELI